MDQIIIHVQNVGILCAGIFGPLFTIESLMTKQALQRYASFIRTNPPRSLKGLNASQMVVNDILRAYSTKRIWRSYSIELPNTLRFVVLHLTIVFCIQLILNFGTVLVHKTHSFGVPDVPPHFEYGGYHFHFYRIREIIGVSLSVMILSMPLDFINTSKTLTFLKVARNFSFLKGRAIMLVDLVLTILIALLSGYIILISSAPILLAEAIGGANPFVTRDGASFFSEIDGLLTVLKAVLIGLAITAVLIALVIVLQLVTLLIKLLESVRFIRIFVLRNTKFGEHPLSITGFLVCVILTIAYFLDLLFKVA
jgi:hypothetical protein